LVLPGPAADLLPLVSSPFTILRPSKKVLKSFSKISQRELNGVTQRSNGQLLYPFFLKNQTYI